MRGPRGGGDSARGESARTRSGQAQKRERDEVTSYMAEPALVADHSTPSPPTACGRQRTHD
ncbi:amidohydrolase family protein [Anopheles sinensis]|uniref:Amidohydrolase family protein n=1 Tax=Anopheles sinensis TaxID=74873 RepID=A0A084W3S8_ANOSI|nr:amidohydrolase family protein [Anopheles sinensis]